MLTETDFEEKLSIFRQQVQEKLTSGGVFECSKLLDTLPDNALDGIQGSEPRIVELEFFESGYPFSYYDSPDLDKLRQEIFDDNWRKEKLEPAQYERIEEVIKEEADKHFLPDSPDWSTSKEFGNITLTITARKDRDFKRTRDLAFNEQGDKHIAYGDFVSINGTYMLYPERRGWLTENLAPLVTLAEKHRQVQEEHGNPFSNYIIYNGRDSRSLTLSTYTNFPRLGDNVIGYSDGYTEQPISKSVTHTKNILLHELGHVRNGDMDPNSPQKQALSKLSPWRQLTEVLSTTDSPEGLSLLLFDIYHNPDTVLNKIRELDDMYRTLTPIAKTSAEYMEKFYGFESIDAINVAADMERNNRFVKRVLDMPSTNQADERALDVHYGITGRLGKVPRAKVTDEFTAKKPEIEEAIRKLGKDHGALFGHAETLDFCYRHISQAMEYRADLTTVELSDDPETALDWLDPNHHADGRSGSSSGLQTCPNR